jgi:hypothetical protein
MAGFELDGLGLHALRHEALKVHSANRHHDQSISGRSSALLLGTAYTARETRPGWTIGIGGAAERLRGTGARSARSIALSRAS